MAKQNLLTSSNCLGADILIKLLKTYTQTINDVRQTITVGIVGLPNVGKSSVINSLKRSHACKIGSMPGLTRIMQEIKLDKHIKLLDCPGVVMSKEEDINSLALKNCVKIENIKDPLGPIELLLKRCNKEQLIIRYKIAEFADATQFLNLVAKKCGKIKKDGIPDVAKAAQLILNDWISGKLSYYSQPPELKKATDTKVITEFSPAFNIDDLLKEETELFNSIDDTKVLVDGIEIESSKSTLTSFDELESVIETDKKESIFKSDLALNPKVVKKNQKADQIEKMDEDRDLLSLKLEAIKRKSSKAATKKSGKDSDNENDFYESENIPRSKKMHKMEIKKKVKKERKNEKLFSNLGDMMNSVKIASKNPAKIAGNELFDFKTDFKK
jgi:nuclear GTP-binding protein